VLVFLQGYGYCHTHNCIKSHDITLAVDMARLTKVSEPRKRRRLKGEKWVWSGAFSHQCLFPTYKDKGTKKPKIDENNGSHDSHMTQQPVHNSLPGIFETEIAAAKIRLTDAMVTSHTGATPIPLLDQPVPQGARFHSHRAGLDAFMTAFSFACYALQAAQEGGMADGRGKPDLSGLADMKNCLASRRRGQHHLPLTIFKSKYAKNSAHFTSNREQLLLVATPTAN